MRSAGIRTALVGFVSLVLTSGAGAQDGPEPRRPDRTEVRSHLQEQLDRLRERERWLTAQIEAMDRGEKPEGAEADEPRHRPGWSSTPEERRRLLAVLRDLQSDPELAEGESPFRQVLETEGPERDRLLMRLAPRLKNLAELRGGDPEMYEASRREMIAGIKIARAARMLGMALRNPESNEESLRQARRVLRAAIADGFDARAATARLEVRSVQAKLDGLIEEVTRAEAERDSRIDEQLESFVARMKDDAGKGLSDDGAMDENSRPRGPRPSRDD